MKRVAIILVAATLLCVLALPAYSISTTVNRCTAVAQQLLDHADPLDRNPPPRVVAAINKWIHFENLSSILATTLLDRFACSGGNPGVADWAISQPALSWQLERKFGAQLVALYSATAQMKTGTTGFSHMAQRLYDKPLDQLDDSAAACLIERATGKWLLSRGGHWPDILTPCPPGVDAPPPVIVE